MAVGGRRALTPRPEQVNNKLVAHSKNGTSEQGRSFIERARREQIVRAAVDTISEVGYGRASYARIARRASISPSLISYHFADRADLMREAASSVVDDLRRGLRDATPNPASYPEALAALITHNVHYAAGHLRDLTALAELRAAGMAPADAGPDQGRADLERLLADGQAAGEYGAFTPTLMAATLLAALEAVPAVLAREPDIDPAHYATELAETFRRATAPAPAAHRTEDPR